MESPFTDASTNLLDRVKSVSSGGTVQNRMVGQGGTPIPAGSHGDPNLQAALDRWMRNHNVEEWFLEKHTRTPFIQWKPRCTAPWRSFDGRQLSLWTLGCSSYGRRTRKKKKKIPPIRYNWVPYGVTTIGGESVLVCQLPSDQPRSGSPHLYPGSSVAVPPQAPQPVAGRLWPQPPSIRSKVEHVQDSDVCDDEGLTRVLHCLGVLAREQFKIMMMISELVFRKYLDSQVSPVSAADCPLLPDLYSMDGRFLDEDFDVVKSIGATPNTTDSAIVKKMDGHDKVQHQKLPCRHVRAAGVVVAAQGAAWTLPGLSCGLRVMRGGCGGGTGQVTCGPGTRAVLWTARDVGRLWWRSWTCYVWARHPGCPVDCA
ncbi:uncharacterized protein LOC143291579 [Babylonia areolata]|uniref:uncharacterized protein LOC143291579 n=1 Tax=Babylonia areolata TaxID=304850 RepID=UPI003FD3B3D7